MGTKSSSAEKRNRQAIAKQASNKAVKSSAKSAIKKVLVAIQKKDKVESATSFKVMAKKLDTAARKGIISRNSVARKKSRMQKLINSTVL